MAKIAVDIVLLLPADIAELCISANKKAAEKNAAEGELNTSDFLPHITLCMG